MKRIPLTTASAAQLATYANAYLGLDVDPKMSAAKIRSVMETTGYAKDYIEVEETAAVSPVRASARAEIERLKNDRVVIRVQNQPGAGGREAIPVGLNGTVYRIQRGVDVAVPRPIVEILNHANMVEYQTNQNGEIINGTEVPTHPFSIVRDPA